MAEPRDTFLARRKQELFTDLRQVHDLLTDYQDEHGKTGHGCKRSGQCCQVGLQLHMMECEYLANNLKAMAGNDPELLEPYIERLEHAFTDEGWTWDSSVGDQMCAFLEDGCTVYPFRPSICRMYGVVLESDDFCPRTRLANGKDYLYVQKDVDRMVAKFYRTVDNYGKLYPKLDYTVYMPAGVLYFLLDKERYAKLKASTPKRFWRRQRGYRTQFQPSYRAPPKLRTNVTFPFAIPAIRGAEAVQKVAPTTTR